MPRPKGGSGQRSSSGHSYTTRSSSGRRISSSPARRPGSSRSGYDLPDTRMKDRSSYRPDPMPGPGYRGGAQDRYRRRSSGFLPGFLMGSLLSGRQRRRYQPPVYDNGPMYRRRRGTSLVWILVIVIIVIFLLSAMSGCASSDSQAGSSSHNREKITASQPYDADCIVDEAGFFENPSGTGQRLKSFLDRLQSSEIWI